MRPGCAYWVPPAGSRSSRGRPRRLAWLLEGYRLRQTVATCAVKMRLGQRYRGGRRRASGEESWYFVQLCHELCKLKKNNVRIRAEASAGLEVQLTQQSNSRKKPSKSTISLFSLMFKALLTMKLSSSSESESCTLACGRGSDAGLLFIFLVGNVMATLRPVDLRPRLADPQFTF